jgi:hypothetical protein
MDDAMWADMQIFWYVVILFGALVVAGGGFMSSIETKRSGDRDQAELRTRYEMVQGELKKFEATLDKHTTKVLDAVTAKPDDNWRSIQLDNFPAEVADYALLLFRSSGGRIAGKVRLKGSKSETLFSTSANNNIPLAVPNAWDPNTGHYRIPATLEYVVTAATNPDARLTILTAGWIDSRGTEPHP